MYKILLLFLFFTVAQAQTDSTWTAFFDADYNRGFKDAGGKVMIAPKFTGFTRALKFDQVIMAMEYTPEEGYEDYYLLKNGRQFGQDSVYYPGLSFYCESEGLIPFVAESGVGMFNGEGKVAIPAVYNDVYPCLNGYIVALSGAKREYDGEYGYWAGGKYSLIDRHNNLIVSDFNIKEDVDFYSAQVTDVPPADPKRVVYKAVDGKYHSFIDSKKLFKQFLEDSFLNNLTAEKFEDYSFPVLIYEDIKKERTWRKEAGTKNPNFKIIAECLSEIKKPGAEYSIYGDNFNIPDGLEPNFEKYGGNCDAIDQEKFPMWEVVITHILMDKNNNPVRTDPDAPASFSDGFDRYADRFTFIKTEDGFKLLSVTLGNKQMK